jgi:hypothetical protein
MQVGDPNKANGVSTTGTGTTYNFTVPPKTGDAVRALAAMPCVLSDWRLAAQRTSSSCTARHLQCLLCKTTLDSVVSDVAWPSW